LGATSLPEDLDCHLLHEAQACLGKLQSGLAVTDKEKQALEQFFILHMPLLERFVAGRRLPCSDAEDCLQEVCTRILEGLAGFHSDGRQCGCCCWMKEIVCSQAARIHRHRQQHPTEPLGPHREASLACAGAGPDAECEQHETQEAVRHALELLRKQVPDLTYLAFSKRCMEWKTVDEIAAELNLEKQEVSRCIYEAKEKFRDLYERLHSKG
jgi:RNA polymerase sigma factor (sigma-70 family)